MAQGGDEWELCKENVQPLRQGRAMSTLQEVLCQQDSANHHAIQQKKQAFELELRFYTGDDPLDVWDRYIKWAEQAFPQGGKDSNLSPLLERAVKIFHQEQKYYADLRYLNICLKFARFCTEPVDLYSYLYSQGIGVQHAQLYITWAEEYEARDNYKKADSIFQDGIQHRAEPLEKLETHHKQFQARVSRQVILGVGEAADEEDPEVADPQRSSLVALKAKGKNKARAPVNRVGDAVKSRSHGVLSAPPPQQIPSRVGFAVFDENSGVPGSGATAPVTVQPWAALPPARAKENEQKAGTWNSKRPSRSSHHTSGSEPSQSFPSFTPYVEEMAQQQTVTPCKINPSISNVLSSRKPGKEEDPLQRLQSSSQGKEEMVMYCKNKVYAGVEEFSIEEIRAEIYMAKIRKKREEELKAFNLRRLEMEKQIEEMEKKLKGNCLSSQETDKDQPEESRHLAPKNTEVEGACVDSTVTASAIPSTGILLGAQDNSGSTESCPALSSSLPFTIFDETCETQPDVGAQNGMHPPIRRPMAPVSRALDKQDAPLTDTLDDIEHLSEDAIVTGSNRNKTLFADTEDTCDFMRAAQLASTPFQKNKDNQEGGDTSGLERVPLREKTPVCEKSYRQVVCPKELSPILEASQEDTRSSMSSVSSVSAGSASLFASKTLIIKGNLDLVSQMSGVYEQALEEATGLDCTKLQSNMLEAMPELLASEVIIREAGQMPALGQEKVPLGNESYHLKNEIILGESNKLYLGAQADCEMEDMKGVALKVDLKPLPWDFYIVQQLKERLGEAFQTHFVEQSNCYLFQDGCITLYRDVCPFSVQDIIQDPEMVVEQVTILFAYNLLSLVEKLHTAEIVHGDLRPETLLLDTGIFDLSSCTEMNNCLKLIDFSHSVDMRLCPTLTAKAFPVAQTKHGQQILSPQASPYQVDILGIADVVHLMIFKKPLHIQQEDSLWKITKEIPRFCNGSLWNTFFSKILNTTHESSAEVLKELKDKMAEFFDSCFQDEVCTYFIQLEMRLNPL
ncbi:mitotic checkpoint serine/threonine-protein kinase BUB1 beta [Hyla sarda]|uniref:mitotic checkpoint serine/threonine-protein kinase BUB1 beta n=1 Tax=Hyla sarda TaxID=327740 RepID=UPI0024C2A709|nr:mitotic checkpoint serine/threonine-protein kinase BUB1 beta [Hyla sarda]XP_056400974.1 mitotic checkpoint serine/threonine-protein kinase BUB1 beta [Hyla sarda]XP_056400975.1 mitotic checkpoint serine/threonine-protein kinase BUB1 beta [Hyla sarda]